MAFCLLAIGYSSQIETFFSASPREKGVIVFFFGVVPAWVAYDGITRNVRNWTYWFVGLFLPFVNIPVMIAYVLYGRRHIRDE